MPLLNIEEILVDPHYIANNWDLLNNTDKKFHFVAMLTPLFEYVFKNLSNYIEYNCIDIQNIIADENLRAMIKWDLVDLLTPIIIRTCVFEMYGLKENGLLKGETSEQRFDYFIQLLIEPKNAWDLLNKYPILNQILTTSINQYLATSIEVFQRLNIDAAELFSKFLNSDFSYHLVNIKSSGDRHNQGHCVKILAFKNKQGIKKVVYKPRSLAVDCAFQNYLAWFNIYSKKNTLRIQLIVNKLNYGWCEFIEYKSCSTKQLLQNFYYRLGSLLALVYTLGGTDIHAENIIAEDEQPIIIDYECILRPFILFDKVENGEPQRHMVTATHFLPAKFHMGDKTEGMDLSAFGSEQSDNIGLEALCWEKIGTDEMHAVRKLIKVDNFLNMPTLLGKNINPLDYQHDFILGFEAGYLIILRHLAELLSDNSPLHKFKHVEIRVLFRPTSQYSKLLYESFHPKLLIIAEVRKAHFSWLTTVADDGYYNGLFESELADLEENNIPVFNCQSDSLSLLNSSCKPVTIKLTKTAFDCVYRHLTNTINESDLIIQKTLIQTSFAVAEINKKTVKTTPRHCLKNLNQNIMTEPLKDKALDLARKELDKLDALKIINRGRIFWPTIEKTDFSSYAAGFTDIHFYDGIAGIALAFACGAAVFNDERYYKTTQLCLQSLRNTMLKRGEKCYSNVGAFSGLGGHIYLFTRLYNLWQDQQLKIDLEQVVSFLPLLIETDTQLDIIGGAAGALAAILTTQGILPDALIKKTADLCIEHLFKMYPEPSELPHTDTSLIIKPLLGFAHGVAGIAWALAKYDAKYPSKQVKQWIKAALVYERSEFSKQQHNWPDFRKFVNTQANYLNSFSCAWCHGAPGIGLARLEMKNYYEDPALDEEIKYALQTTVKQGFGNYQGLCHGNLGNLDFLLLAQQKFNQTELTKIYHENAIRTLQYIEIYGAQCGKVPSFATPGLMTGMAGVIYQLLRIAEPEKIPSVLCMAA